MAAGVWQHSSGGNQKEPEQPRGDAKIVGSVVSLWWGDMRHVEASADWLVWRASLRTEGVVALVDERALMEMGVGGFFTA